MGLYWVNMDKNSGEREKTVILEGKDIITLNREIEEIISVIVKELKERKK